MNCRLTDESAERTKMSMRKRNWIAASAAIATVALLAACSGTPAATKSSTPGTVDTTPVNFTYVSYGGTGQAGQIDAWQKPYTALHPNVTFANSSPPDPAQVKAQVLAGSIQWNIVTTAPYLAEQNCGTLYEPLKLTGVDKSSYDGTIGKCYIPDFAYGLIFSYNTAKWPNPATAPKTVADFFDTKKFPGKRGIVPNLQDGVLEWGLLADGVKADKLYPLDVDRAIAKYQTIKSDTIFAANPGALLQLVTSGQVDMQVLVQARSQAALDAGAKMTPVWDQTLTSIDGIAIPKGAANKEAAEQFLSFILQPTQSAKMSELTGAGASNNKAKPVLTANGETVNAFGKANTGKSIKVDFNYWAKNFNQNSAKFITWLNG